MNTFLQYNDYLANEDETVASGERLGHCIDDGALVFLEGTLGAGKTTFCRGVLRAFGYSGPVKSPTYTLVEPYNFVGQTVYHFDLYRLGDAEELEFMGFRDYFANENLSLIEWPEKGKGFIPIADLVVSLTPEAAGRRLRIKSVSQRGNAILSLLEVQRPLVE